MIGASLNLFISWGFAGDAAYSLLNLFYTPDVAVISRPSFFLHPSLSIMDMQYYLPSQSGTGKI